MVLVLEAPQQLVEEDELAARGDKPVDVRLVVDRVQPLGLDDALDEKGVVAAVAQLHRDVVEGGAGARRVGAAQQHGAVALEDGAVAPLLEVGDLYADHCLLHRRQS